MQVHYLEIVTPEVDATCKIGGSSSAVGPRVLGTCSVLATRSLGGTSDSDGVQKDEEGYINLKISIASLPEDGSPQSVKVYDDKIDAWNKFKNVEVGTVWLRHDPSTDEVIAFNTICPHLGCAIDYRQANADFYCPCHTSTFDISGKRLNKIPPRDMDPLDVKIKDDQIWLKYENFRAGTEERTPV